MKTNWIRVSLVLFVILGALQSRAQAQLSFTVNSLADDDSSYAYDDPNTPEDESRDGKCGDELGRCTLRAAIDESINMDQPVDLGFSVSGTINLIDVLYPVDGSSIRGENKIEIAGGQCFEIGKNTLIAGVRFNNCFTAITVTGSQNTIGDNIISSTRFLGNTFLNCYIAVAIEGDSNKVEGNMFGVDTTNAIGPNQVGIMITGSVNAVGWDTPNTICKCNVAGISISEGNSNFIAWNYIGTNAAGDTGLGNKQGIVIGGSDFNTIGKNDLDFNVIAGNEVEGIAVSGVPPDSYSDGTTIQYNKIGVTPRTVNGDFQIVALPNQTGIALTNGVQFATISNNWVAGNSVDGISIFGYDADSKTGRHVIEGNDIGIIIEDQPPRYVRNGGNGIDIQGNVEDVLIGASGSDGAPNSIVRNLGAGIRVASEFGYTPSKIRIRKNKIYQNAGGNLNFQVSGSLQAPTGLAFNAGSLTGTYPDPDQTIDVYKSDPSDSFPSEYEWLGSTTTNAQGAFSFPISDPTVQAVSVTATDTAGNTSDLQKFDLVTSAGQESLLPTEFALGQNYPNPFNPSTTISFALPVRSSVRLQVIDLLGRVVAHLVDGEFEAGYQRTVWNATVASGLYFYRIEAVALNGPAKKFVDVKRMVLIK